MATLVFTAIGTLIGGPLGGVIGAMAGQQVDGMLFGGSAQGPRLNDLTVSTSAYGSPMARHFGQMRVAGSIIWATNLVEHSSTSGGGARAARRRQPIPIPRALGWRWPAGRCCGWGGYGPMAPCCAGQRATSRWEAPCGFILAIITRRPIR